MTPPAGPVDTAADLDRDIRSVVRDVVDFPKQGIVFKDITGVLIDGALFRRVIKGMADAFAKEQVSHVVGIESRGFIFGAPIAAELGAGFVPMRKPGKLPSVVERVEYSLEYGVDALEVRRDALHWGHRVLIVDDVLATGGTAKAACDLIALLGSHLVGCGFLLELTALRGARRLGNVRSHALTRY